MRTMGDTAVTRRWPESVRWTVCFALAVAFHVAGGAALMARWNDDSDLVANAPVITIELAALPVAPETTPNELPPGPQQQDAEPEPEPEKPVEKKQELPADPKAEPLQAVVPPKVVEKPREKKPKQKHASLASAPSSPMRCRTGNRNLLRNSSATNAIRPKRSRTASRALRNSLSASTAAAAFTTPTSHEAPARACLTRQRWHWLHERRPYRPHHRRLPEIKFRSRCRSATTCGNLRLRQPAFWSTGAALA